MNGYTNWETWNVMLWASNDEPTYRRIEDFLRSTEVSHDDVPLVRAFFRLRVFPTGTPDMASRKELAAVNWDEITKHMNEWND